MEALALYTTYEEGGQELVAVFVKDHETPEPEARAHEVMTRMLADGTRGDYFALKGMVINPSNKELGLKPTLGEIDPSDFVEAAYRSIHEHGEAMAPVWISPEWLRHEVEARYNIAINLRGRQLNAVKIKAAPDDGFVESEQF